MIFIKLRVLGEISKDFAPVSGLSQKTLQEDFAPLSVLRQLGAKQVLHPQISQAHLPQISQVLLSQIEDDLAPSRCTEVTKL